MEFLKLTDYTVVWRSKIGMMVTIYQTSLLLSLLYPIQIAAVPADVQTPLGTIRGVEMDSPSGNKVYAFLGVPYAEPPKRFKKPEALKPWNGIKNATSLGKICSQQIWPFMIDMLPVAEISEDCLLCDIYVPINLSGQNSRAVVIWLLPGTFIEGQTGIFARVSKLGINGDVINVVVANRLGVFGFLSTGDKTIPGNFALWDQKMAIEWVKTNIKSFGGDPTRITLAGSEAGGISAILQAMTPLNMGNFQRVLAHSEVTTANEMLWYDAPKHAGLLAQHMCVDLQGKEITSQQVYDCLILKSEKQLIDADAAVMNGNFWKLFGYNYGPVIDNDFFKYETDFKSLLPVDVLVSIVDNEHLWRVYEQLAQFENKYKFSSLEKIPKDVLCKEFIPDIVRSFYRNITDQTGLIQFICNKYTSSDVTEQSRNALRMFGDFFHYHPVTDLIQSHSTKYTDKNTHLCLFSERSPFPGIIDDMPWLQGSGSGDDTIYLIVVDPLDPSMPTQAVAVTNKMINYWASFIRTGDPNSGKPTVNWPKYNTITQQYLNLKSDVTTGSFLFADRMNFWRSTVPAFISPIQNSMTTSTTTTKTNTTTTTETTTTPTTTTSTKTTTTTTPTPTKTTMTPTPTTTTTTTPKPTTTATKATTTTTTKPMGSHTTTMSSTSVQATKKQLLIAKTTPSSSSKITYPSINVLFLVFLLSSVATRFY